MHGMCKKCGKMGGLLFLALGIVLLLKDLGTWDFWGINWWTGFILLFGLMHIGKNVCGDCSGGVCEMPATTAKKRRR